MILGRVGEREEMLGDCCSVFWVSKASTAQMLYGICQDRVLLWLAGMTDCWSLLLEYPFGFHGHFQSLMFLHVDLHYTHVASTLPVLQTFWSGLCCRNRFKYFKDVSDNKGLIRVYLTLLLYAGAILGCYPRFFLSFLVAIQGCV